MCLHLFRNLRKRLAVKTNVKCLLFTTSSICVAKMPPKSWLCGEDMKDFNPCPEDVKQELYFGFWITFESPLTKITSSLFSRIDSMHKLYPDMMNLLWCSKNKKIFCVIHQNRWRKYSFDYHFEIGFVEIWPLMTTLSAPSYYYGFTLRIYLTLLNKTKQQHNLL